MEIRWFREYETVDIDTGEIIKNAGRKYYRTIEIITKYIKNEESRYGNNWGRSVTTRYVKHTGQTRMFD